MGYDTRLLFGPRLAKAKLDQLLPDTFRETGETLAYDDFMAPEHPDVIGVAVGRKTTIVADPGRLLPDLVRDRWAELDSDMPLVRLDLNETTSEYAIEVREGAVLCTRRWENQTLVQREGKLRTGQRFPRHGAIKSLFEFIERLGHDENPLDWEFSVRARRAAPRGKKRTSKLDMIASGPPFWRTLFLSEPDSDQVLAKLSRYARLEYEEPLQLRNVLAGCMSATHIAIAGCRDYSVLFDESGSLAFDIRWLAPSYPRRALAVWGHVEASGVDPRGLSALSALRAPPVLGLARYDAGVLTRRMTWAGGRATTSLPPIPPTMLAETGVPTPQERLLARAKAGATFEDVKEFLSECGFDPEPMLGATFRLFRVRPH